MRVGVAHGRAVSALAGCTVGRSFGCTASRGLWGCPCSGLHTVCTVENSCPACPHTCQEGLFEKIGQSEALSFWWVGSSCPFCVS